MVANVGLASFIASRPLFLFSPLRASSMSSAKYVNPDAEVVAKDQALALNCAAANGLQMVLRSNLGEPV